MLIGIEKEEQVELSAAQDKYSRLKDSLKPSEAEAQADKDIRDVENILVDMKKNAVARHEPLLVIGGGVISDIAGFASALYSRNTPYVMLCTSIVSGIDAGPSPRTRCNGFDYKNLYGAYHPPVLTITDRGLWRTLHRGWLRHGIAEIINMAVVEDRSLSSSSWKNGGQPWCTPSLAPKANAQQRTLSKMSVISSSARPWRAMFVPSMAICGRPTSVDPMPMGTPGVQVTSCPLACCMAMPLGLAWALVHISPFGRASSQRRR